MAFLVGVFGSLIGSFLNVVAYRVPLRRSIISPPSACTNCSRAIRGFDNIPVLSWLILGGRCRNCGTRISARYPLVELGTALLFGAVTWRFIPGFAWAPSSALSTISAVLVLIALLYLASISIALALIDLDTQRLPNSIVLPAYIVGLVLLGAAAVADGDFGALLRAAMGLCILWAAYLGLALVYRGGMGFGDVKLAGVLGLFLGYLGWGELIVGAFAAFLLGGLFAVGLLLARRANRKSGIPFGPWMLAGAWVGIFFGDALWTAYLTVLGVA
jgi:leader peptidase (prepilin peptidase) / N-methyltransferase